MSTPNATDFYSRFMVEMFDERDVQATPRAFQAFFGNPLGMSRTVFSENEATVEIDILRANGERLSAMIHRGQVSDDVSRQKNVTEQKGTNIVRVYPLIEEEGNINSTQLLKRILGDNPFARRKQIDRMRELARDIHYDHIRKIVRTNELLASKSILTGQMPAIIGTTNTSLIYDFYRKATHDYNVTNKWDSGSQTILADIDDALDLIREDAYMKANFMALGSGAMNAFIADTAVKALADNRRFQLIEVNSNPVPSKFQRLIDAGWTARGRLMTPAGRVVWMFTNDDIYTDLSGTTQNYMPTDKVFFIPVEARMDRYYGPRDRLPVTSQEAAWYNEQFGFNMEVPPMPPNVETQNGIIVPASFFSDAYAPDGKKTVVLRTQQAPIFATTQTDAIVVLGEVV